jgi:hypothetical protein
MKRNLFLSLVFLLSGADVMACTRDARICNDGSARGRDPNRNCQFWPPCPEDRGAKLQKQNHTQLLCANVEAKEMAVKR